MLRLLMFGVLSTCLNKIHGSKVDNSKVEGSTRMQAHTVTAYRWHYGGLEPLVIEVKHTGGGRCSPGLMGWPMFPHPVRQTPNQHNGWKIRSPATLELG